VFEVHIDVLQQWSEEPSGQVADQLSRVSTEVLAAALESLEASDMDAFDVIMDSNCNVETGNWTYTAVQPCRVADTRFATGSSPISTGGTREFFVWGSGLTTQNGGVDANNPDVCPAPDGEPRAVHFNVTAVPSSGAGNLNVYAAGTTRPNTAFVNFPPGPGVAVGNNGTIKTRCEIGASEIEIFAATETHVVIDVMGYYYDLPVAE
jgi:hypothetical protein